MGIDPSSRSIRRHLEQATDSHAVSSRQSFPYGPLLLRTVHWQQGKLIARALLWCGRTSALT
jgi:hypothetical protein